MERELARIDQKWGSIAGIAEEYVIRAYKKDIFLTVFGVGWLPHWVVTSGGAPAVVPAW